MTKNIYQKLHAIMSEVSYIQKEKGKKDGLKYSYVRHDDVTAKLHEQFVKHGVLAIPSVTKSKIHQFNATKWDYKEKRESNYTVYRADVTMEVEFVDVDVPQDKVKTVGWSGMGLDTQDKAVGKATSYAYKYCLLKTFALETGDDVESDQESNYVKKDPVLSGVIKTQDLHREAAEELYQRIKQDLKNCKSVAELKEKWSASTVSIRSMPPELKEDLNFIKEGMKQELEEAFDTGDAFEV